MDRNETPNSARTLWEAFRRTGSVSAYMAYRGALEREREKQGGPQPPIP